MCMFASENPNIFYQIFFGQSQISRFAVVACVAYIVVSS